MLRISILTITFNKNGIVENVSSNASGNNYALNDSHFYYALGRELMKQKLVAYFSSIQNTYNELVVQNLMLFPMLIVGGILIGIFKGLLALFVYTIITLLLLAPAYFLVIKPRTCPSCKSFKYSTAFFIQGWVMKIKIIRLNTIASDAKMYGRKNNENPLFAYSDTHSGNEEAFYQ